MSAIRGDRPAETELLGEQVEALVLALAAASDNEELFSERIAELELAVEDKDWVRAGMEGKFEFDRSFIDEMIHTSRLYYIKNPVIRRPVELQTFYVWAQGVSIYAEGEPNEVVQAFVHDFANRRSLTGHDAMADNERRQRVDGNLFFRFFINPANGRTRIRRLPVEEIRDIVCNPDDVDEVWFYVRKFLRGTTEVKRAYPDWMFWRQRKVEKAGVDVGTDEIIVPESGWGLEEDVVIDWDTPVMHRKTGAFGDMKFGIPETYAAIDWARAYKSALEDYKKTIRSLATWAWKLKMSGGKNQLAAAQSLLGTTFGSDSEYSETNPAPTRGSVWAGIGENDLKAVDVSKAVIDPDGFRRLLLMSATSMGMPEVYYGAAEGTFATAKAMDRPTELQFLDRQGFWREVWTDILTIVCEAAATAAGNDRLGSDGYDEYTTEMLFTVKGKPTPLVIKVKYPPILQQNVQEYLQALTTFTTQNGQALQALNDGPTLYRIALTSLGVDNVEEIVRIFYPEEGESKARPIETYEPPLSPEDVQEDLEKQLAANKDKAEQQAQSKADAAARMAAGPLGSQPRNQGAAGGDKEPAGRGGPNATAREASDIDTFFDPEYRRELIAALTQLRQEALASAKDA